MKQHFSTDAGKKLTEKIGLVYQFQIAPKVFFLFLIISFHFSLIPKLIIFVNFVENWIQWSYIYRWSQERRSHQRLISFLFNFMMNYLKCIVLFIGVVVLRLNLSNILAEIAILIIIIYDRSRNVKILGSLWLCCICNCSYWCIGCN